MPFVSATENGAGKHYEIRMMDNFAEDLSHEETYRDKAIGGKK